jgi:glycosyltransferase involved in cell wall biosynthesis
MEISIVIPTYNSSNYIENTIHSIVGKLNKICISYEIIIIDDNSEDDTFEKCISCKKRYSDVNLKIIKFDKNYGQRICTSIGYENAKGNYVLTYDDDMQYDINYLKEMLVLMKAKKAWVISTFYNNHKKNEKYNLTRKIVLFIFNNILFYNYRNTKYFSSFKLVDKLTLEKHRIKNIFYFWEIPNHKILALKIKKENRIYGNSTYNFKNYIRMFSHIAIRISLYFYFLALLYFIIFSYKNQIILPIIFLIIVSYGYLIVDKNLIFIHKKKYEIH